jgi:hypothetical protein
MPETFIPEKISITATTYRIVKFDVNKGKRGIDTSFEI